jgi:elongation factor Ts
MDCRTALLETGGDKAKALQILQERGSLKAKKTAGRVAKQGLVEAYIHGGGRIGAIVEINCETDFVARTDEFKELVHDIAMQVAAMSPEFVCREDVPAGADVDFATACLLLQPYIKDPTKTVQDVITEVIARVGENIKVSRFARFELGQSKNC